MGSYHSICLALSIQPHSSSSHFLLPSLWPSLLHLCLCIVNDARRSSLCLIGDLCRLVCVCLYCQLSLNKPVLSLDARCRRQELLTKATEIPHSLGNPLFSSGSCDNVFFKMESLQYFLYIVTINKKNPHSHLSIYLSTEIIVLPALI